MKIDRLRWGKAFGVTLLSVFALLCFLPLIAVISISLTEESYISLHGYSLWPRAFTTEAYSYVLKTTGWQLSRAYLITISTTVIGTSISLITMSLMAYAISRPDFKWAKPLSFFAYATLLFNGGMVPTYMVVSRVLHLKDTLFALILPYTIGAWNLLLMRTLFKSIPYELIEAAKIDGAGNFKIYLKIIVPLGKTAFATIGSLVALQYWNDWWLPLLYIDSNRLLNLQFLLYRIMANIQSITEMAAMGVVDVDFSKLPSETVRMAICVLAAGPMLVVFPFFQKYFARGLTVGSIKG
jgi:putative aldouronate transport system permease protein